MSEETLAYLAARFGAPAEAVSFPGGRRRKTALYRVGDRKVAVSRRRSAARARIEADILRTLEPHGLAPRLLFQEGVWVVQEAVDGRRLPVLFDQEPKRAEAVLSAAWQALFAAQSALEVARDTLHLPLLGIAPEWQAKLADMPSRLGQVTGVPVPPHAFGALLETHPDETGPVKWDARPGNAMERADGRICWFDWEHAGLRNRADDAVWLLGDEWAPDAPAIWAHAQDDLCVGTSRSPLDMARRMDAHLVAHSCVRLLLILDLKGGGPWWSAARCLREDRVGVTLSCALRLTGRAGQAASRVEGLTALCSFFEAIGAYLKQL